MFNDNFENLTENYNFIYELKFNFIDDKYKPLYQTKQAAYADLYIRGNHTIKNFESKEIPTGIILENLNQNYYLSIKSRSSTFKNGLMINNGVIDPDYKEEIFISVKNLSGNDIQLNDLDRIAQITINKLIKIDQFKVLDKERGNESTNDDFKHMKKQLIDYWNDDNNVKNYLSFIDNSNKNDINNNIIKNNNNDNDNDDKNNINNIIKNNNDDDNKNDNNNNDDDKNNNNKNTRKRKRKKVKTQTKNDDEIENFWNKMIKLEEEEIKMTNTN